MGILSVPLPGAVRSGSYGFDNETYDFPATVELQSADYPIEPGPDNSPSAHRANTGDIAQSLAPSYAGQYELDFMNAAGVSPGFAGLPQDLSFPRDTGGVTGTNRLIHSTGPVTGAPDNRFTGERAVVHTPVIGQAGPVSGGMDYSSQLASAYYAQQAGLFSQAASEAALISAV